MRFLTLLLCLLTSVGNITDASIGPVKIHGPDELILGDRSFLKVVGLPANTPITLTSELIDRVGRLWRASADFQSSASGEIDLAKVAPLAGTYSGIDALGLYWSMQDTKVVKKESPLIETFERSVVVFRVLQGDKTLAEKSQTRWRQASGVQAEEVKDQGFLATFYRPQNRLPRAGIILVGGSGGGIGWQRNLAAILASKGYCALALAYFNAEGLSPNLEKIPLEYFQKAIAWMSANPAVDKKHLAIIGVSKGGELALVLGSQFPQLTAVVAYVPSSVVFQSIIFQSQTTPDPLTSSWTYKGEELPFVPYASSEKYRQSRKLVDLYEATLENHVAVEKAVIKVENIRGPVLLLSGTEDAVWPSTRMAEAVIGRLKQFKHRYADKHIAFAEAGHAISLPGYYPTAETLRNGGTAKANGRAQTEAWEEVLTFLNQNVH